jgi:hypothetical protein
MRRRKTTARKTTAGPKAAQGPALGEQSVATSTGLDLTVAEVNVLMTAALQLPQPRGSQEYHIMNGAITKLQTFMMQAAGANMVPPA